jgi:hypothetical protein
MTQKYKVKIREIALKSVPGDVSIEMSTYLADENNVPFINTTTNLDADLFAITVQKNSLPTSGLNEYFKHIVNSYVSEKYTLTVSGYAEKSSKIVKNIPDTSLLVHGQSVNSTTLQAETILENIRDKNSVRLSKPALISGQASFSFGIKGWDLDFSELDEILNLIVFGNM